MTARPAGTGSRTATRWRTLVAVIGLPLGLTLYALATMLLLAALPRFWASDALIACLLGIAWIWPARRLIRWTRQDAGSEMEI